MWPLTPFRASAATRAIALVLFSLVLATYVWWPMIHAAPKTADLDGRYFLQQWEAGKAAIRNYGEFPLWNPFDCRGVPMWDHPESMTGSPLLLLATPLSGTVTLWVWNIVHCAAGFLSMWLLARKDVGLSRTGAFIAGAMWAFGVSHLSQYAGAHSTLADFWLTPLLLFLWRRAEKSVNAAVLLGAVIAFMIYEGATYPLPFVIVVVALETTTRLFPVKRIPRILGMGAVTGSVAFGLSAARLLPLVDQLMSKKRANMLPDVDNLVRANTISRMFLWREGHWYNQLPGQQYVWGEYIAYVGFLALALALVGLVLSLRDRRWLVVLAVLTTLLMLGHYARWAPWELLHRYAFPYKSMRVPSRYRLILQLFIALGVGVAIDRLPRLLERWVPSRRELATGARVLLVGTAFFAAGDAAGLGMDIIDWMHQGPPERIVERSPRFYYGGENLAEWLDQPRQNRSWLGCRSFEWPANDSAPVWTGDVPQAKPNAPSEAMLVVTNVSRTQNTFTFDVDAKAPGRILVNSAHAKGWRSSVGTVVDDGTLLAVDVPAGQHHVRMRYWPKLLTPGIATSAVTIVLLLGFYGLRFVRARRHAR
ncbi:MAG: hypothetical protein ACXWUG_02945 [Polyangiales bacterium]